MLRFNHMPSDFHPLFLFLGEANDLAALANVLRAFAADAKPAVLDRMFPQADTGIRLRIEPADTRFGLRHETGSEFIWRLNAWQAGQLADRIDPLTARALKSGSNIVELGDEGEIPVKISRGEFTDDFLVKKF